MSLDLRDVALVAQAILDRLGHDDTHWTVTEATPVDTDSFAASEKRLETPQTILVTATKTSDATCTISSYFIVGVPTQQAIVQLAASLQDEAIEHLGTAVPPCPEHAHPLIPRVDHGRAMWTCPRATGGQFAIADID